MAAITEIFPVAMLTIIIAIKVYYLVFALLTIMGGVMGFVKAKSKISLISGSVCGVLLIASSLMLPKWPIRAGCLALLVSVVLAGKFVPDFLHKKVFVPAGLMALLSLASIVLTILALKPK